MLTSFFLSRVHVYVRVCMCEHVCVFICGPARVCAGAFKWRRTAPLPFHLWDEAAPCAWSALIWLVAVASWMRGPLVGQHLNSWSLLSAAVWGLRRRSLAGESGRVLRAPILTALPALSASCSSHCACHFLPCLRERSLVWSGKPKWTLFFNFSLVMMFDHSNRKVTNTLAD